MYKQNTKWISPAGVLNFRIFRKNSIFCHFLLFLWCSYRTEYENIEKTQKLMIECTQKVARVQNGVNRVFPVC